MLEMIKVAGNRVKLIVRRKTVKRLKSRCFRNDGESLSGNFCYWRNIKEVFADNLVKQLFIAEIAKELKENFFGTVSVNIDYSSFVGWASTAPLKRFSDDELEDFKPNRKSTAMRVRKNTKYFAPLTCKLTFVCELKKEEGAWVVIIQSLYPGPDVGELAGNITKREGVAFFGWNHPGAPIRL